MDRRYYLVREFLVGEGTLGFVMLNPSTADAEADDPTIRRCIGFAQREGCSRLVVANVYSQRATKPRDLRGHDRVSALEENAWRRLARESNRVVAAWGQPPRHLPILSFGRRCLRIREILAEEGTPLVALGFTKAGYPRHPLYMRGSAPLVPFLVPVDTMGEEAE